MSEAKIARLLKTSLEILFINLSSLVWLNERISAVV